MKKQVIKTLGAACAAACWGAAFAADLELTEDRTVDVADGETLAFDALTGGEHVLTKTGAGTLQFKALANAAASLVIEGGTVKVAGETNAPAALASATMWFDASRADAFTDAKREVLPAGWSGPVYYWLGDVGAVDGFFKYRSSTGKMPFLRSGAETANGLPLVDFGSQFKSDSGSENPQIPGTGGFMYVVEKGTKTATKCTGLQELFIVASDTEDVKTTIADYDAKGDATRATPFVGSDATTGQICFGRGNRTQSGVNSGIQNVSPGTSFEYVAQGGIFVDGVAATAATPYPDGLHLLEFQPTNGVSVSYFASDRTRWCGGVRIGAVAAFDAKLSAADRAAVRNYLLTRWVGAPIKRLELKDGATLCFENAAGVHAATLAYSGTSTLAGGTLTCDAEENATGTIVPANGTWRYGVGAHGQLPSCAQKGGTDVALRAGWFDHDACALSVAPWFHVDASDESTLTLTPENGTNFVYRWFDADGGDVFAVSLTGGSTPDRKPFLRTKFLNGRAVVDFGGFSIIHQTANAWGASQHWFSKSANNVKTCTNVREVFSVASDTEDLVENWANINAYTGSYAAQNPRGAPFVGNTSKPHFLRGNRDTADLTKGVPMFLNTIVPWATISVAVDGVDVAKDAPYPAGFHVVDVRPGQDGCYGNAFANDRYQSSGGTRIAEFYCFTSELSETERAALTGKLQAKWFGAEPTDVLAYDRLSVDAAATYAAAESKVSVSEAFALAGKMSVNVLELGGTATFATNAVFTGKLKLKDGAALALGLLDPDAAEPLRTFDALALDGGTVTFDFGDVARASLYDHVVPVLAAAKVSGSATFVSGGSLSRVKTRFAWQDGVLYATFVPKGTTLLVR